MRGIEGSPAVAKATLTRRAGGVLAAGGALLAVLAAAATAAIRVPHDSGGEVVLDSPARRIVSLAPHLTELLYAAGAGDHLVATVAFGDYPEPARRLPRVGSSRALDLERIVALRPDLVVAWSSGNGTRPIAALRALGISVYENEPATLADIPGTIERLGALAGTSDVAAIAAGAFRQRLGMLIERYAGREPVSVFHQVWNPPLLTVNGHHPISDLMRVCGGRNVFAHLPALTPAVTIEAVIAVDPEVITTAAISADQAGALELWRRWPSLTATRRDNFLVLHPDVVSRHGPRILDGASKLCEALETARQRRR